MKIIVPSMKYVTVPPWDYRTLHNETLRDIEVSITHDDLKRDHIIIGDLEQSEEAKEQNLKKQE